jgi:hypothetical protein
MVGWVDGETGDFKCLALSNSSPVRLGSRGFSLNQTRAPLLSVQARWRPLSVICTWRISERAARPETYWLFTTFDVVPLAGSSQLTQSECLLGQP